MHCHYGTHSSASREVIFCYSFPLSIPSLMQPAAQPAPFSHTATSHKWKISGIYMLIFIYFYRTVSTLNFNKYMLFNESNGLDHQISASFPSGGKFSISVMPVGSLRSWPACWSIPRSLVAGFTVLQAEQHTRIGHRKECSRHAHPLMCLNSWGRVESQPP